MIKEILPFYSAKKEPYDDSAPLQQPYSQPIKIRLLANMAHPESRETTVNSWL
jgi:hypothetical protein